MERSQIKELQTRELHDALRNIQKTCVAGAGLVTTLASEELAYLATVRSTLPGYVTVAEAAKCFVLETFALASGQNPAGASFTYRNFAAKLVNMYHVLWASEHAANHGYPFSGYVLLRNVFDNALLVCAVLRGLASFSEIEGLEDPEKLPELDVLRRNRMKTENRLREKMLGDQSGLAKDSILQLKKYDEIFDWETHGSRLSMSTSDKWLRNTGDLVISPAFSAHSFAMYMNRHIEISWMLHRLLPLMRADGAEFGMKWQSSWELIDEAFERNVTSLSTELNKPIGLAIAQYVNAKFNFSTAYIFPL